MARTKAPVVECMECATLIYKPADLAPGEELLYGPEFRPKIPRKIHPKSGPRSPRCHTHIKRKAKATRRRSQELRREVRHDMPDEIFEEIKAEQGGFCPCGNRIKAIDHDHQVARKVCDHPEDLSCEECWRGLMCTVCNTHVLGRGYTVPKLLALVDYLLDPPAPRVMRRIWAEEAAS